MSKYTTSMLNPFRLFVYGTLMRNQVNHENFCRTAIDIQPAVVWGRKWQLSAGYPALVIPEELTLATGTTNPVLDANLLGKFSALKIDHKEPKGDWDQVSGEIVTFLNPEREIPPIDRLEGFHVGQASLYHRVGTFAVTKYNILPVWLYEYCGYI